MTTGSTIAEVDAMYPLYQLLGDIEKVCETMKEGEPNLANRILRLPNYRLKGWVANWNLRLQDIDRQAFINNSDRRNKYREPDDE